MFVDPRKETVAGHRADHILKNIQRFRSMWNRYHRPDDVNRLSRMFPHIGLKRGYVLDYIAAGGAREGWIWPFARRAEAGIKSAPPDSLANIPVDMLAVKRDTGELRDTEIETLYNYIDYDSTPDGLFEYAFFISELWATKSASKAGEWLALDPIFTRWQFDSVLRKAGRGLVRVKRPETTDPLIQFSSDGGGEVQFLVYQSRGWKRILYLKCYVDRDGAVRREMGELVANLG